MPSREQLDFFQTLQQHAGWGWALLVLALVVIGVLTFKLLSKEGGATAAGGAASGTGGSADANVNVNLLFPEALTHAPALGASTTASAQLTPAQKQAVADRLQLLDNEAVTNILNGNFENETALISAEENWTHRVIEVMNEGRANLQMISSVSILGDVPNIAYVGKPLWAQKTLRELSLRRKRLKDVIAHYTTEWP